MMRADSDLYAGAGGAEAGRSGAAGGSGNGVANGARFEKRRNGRINSSETRDMKLDEAQMARVREWIDQGMKVAEVQTRLSDEFGLRLTYMEARFLLDDLKLRPKDPAPAKRAEGGSAGGAVLGGSAGGGLGSAAASGPGSGAAAGGGPVPVGPAGGGSPLRTSPLAGEAGGKVAVDVDQIARPGALVSGRVTFSDGQVAEWQLDQYGRLGLAARTPGYKPAQADLALFQAELEGALARMGY